MTKIINNQFGGMNKLHGSDLSIMHYHVRITGNDCRYILLSGRERLVSRNDRF